MKWGEILKLTEDFSIAVTHFEIIKNKTFCYLEYLLLRRLKSATTKQIGSQNA